MGPRDHFRQVLQSLSMNESVWLDAFFSANIVPLESRTDGRFVIAGFDRRYDSVFASLLKVNACERGLRMDGLETIPAAELDALLRESDASASDEEASNLSKE